MQYASSGIIVFCIRHQLKVLETDSTLGGIPDRLVCSVPARPHGQVDPLALLPFQEFPPEERALLRQKLVLKNL